MTKFKMLLVDDDPEVLEGLTQLFGSEYDIYTAGNGEDGLTQVRRFPDIAIIISDQRMPGMRGVDFLKQAKSVAPDSMRILLTGYSDLEAVLESVNVGEVFRYVRKPWQPDALKSIVSLAIATFLLRKQKQQSAERAPLDKSSDAKSPTAKSPLSKPEASPETPPLPETAFNRRLTDKTTSFLPPVKIQPDETKSREAQSDDVKSTDVKSGVAELSQPKPVDFSFSETAASTDDEHNDDVRLQIPLPLPRRRTSDSLSPEFEDDFLRQVLRTLDALPLTPVGDEGVVPVDDFYETLLSLLSEDILVELHRYEESEAKFFERLYPHAKRNAAFEFNAAFYANNKPRMLCMDSSNTLLQHISPLIKAHFDIELCTAYPDGLTSLMQNTFYATILVSAERFEKSDADFFLSAQELAPLIPKILMTALPDAESLISLINQGLLFRHIAMPDELPHLQSTIAESVLECRSRIEDGIGFYR
jgi:CheY-like chemotaxis protein